MLLFLLGLWISSMAKIAFQKGLTMAAFQKSLNIFWKQPINTGEGGELLT